MQVVVSIGDIISPWLSGVGDSKVLGKQERVIDILTKGGVSYAVTHEGSELHAKDVALGLTEQEKARGFSLIGRDTIGKHIKAKSLPLKALREQ